MNPRRRNEPAPFLFHLEIDPALCCTVSVNTIMERKLGKYSLKYTQREVGYVKFLSYWAFHYLRSENAYIL